MRNGETESGCDERGRHRAADDLTDRPRPRTGGLCPRPGRTAVVPLSGGQLGTRRKPVSHRGCPSCLIAVACYRPAKPASHAGETSGNGKRHHLG
jgi:hypothetical protein